MNMAERECKTIKELEKAIYSKIRNAPSPSPPLNICLHLSLSPSLPMPRHFPRSSARAHTLKERAGMKGIEGFDLQQRQQQQQQQQP
jgi:hypothetical protein